VWETWKHAGKEVFLDDGSKPPPWEDMTLEGAPTQPKVFDVAKAALLRATASGIPIQDAARQLTSKNLSQFIDQRKLLFTDPVEGVFNPANFSGGGETRMNRATFDFILDDQNQLYNVEGQEKLYADIRAGKRGPLSFPVESIEVKAMWVPLTDADIKAGKDKQYHVGKDADGKLYGLLSLHVITKDIPNWFWCSFHHKQGKKPLVPPQDSVGQPASLKGTKWENYGLSGTQTDFVDSTGRVTLLSDPYVENGFERSSCITCHAQASIGPARPGRADRLPVFQIQRTNPDVIRPPADFKLPSNFAAIGIPYADQYFDATGKPRYVQLDFLYSLHTRANRKKSK
jgi:hypothetical protein